MREIRLVGPYVRNNTTILKEKAARKYDPRNRFYEAILSSRTYEEYYQNAGEAKVQPATYKCRPVSAHMEIRYARRNGWIADN